MRNMRKLKVSCKVGVKSIKQFQMATVALRWCMKKSKIGVGFVGLQKQSHLILCSPLANVQARLDLFTFSVSVAGSISKNKSRLAPLSHLSIGNHLSVRSVKRLIPL
jgi:hypothetical protein